MESCVLVVSDGLEDRARIARALQSAGHSVELAEDAKRALKLATDRRVVAAIVAMAREPTARSIASELRGAVAKVIALVDSSDGLLPDRSLFPADAFVVRPLNEHNLLARLAELKASPPSPAEDKKPEAYYFEDCRFDLAGRIFVDAAGNQVPLTRSEAELLTVFARNPGRVLSRDQLRHAVAGHDLGAYDRSVDALVARLRRKIEPDPKAPRYIIAVTGAGYKFVAEIGSDKATPSRATLPLPDKPSIAVLPFENMSDDPGQEYFADGMVEDITTRLSRFHLRGSGEVASSSGMVSRIKPSSASREPYA
jgi:DNA-binding response OmpR family regulator